MAERKRGRREVARTIPFPSLIFNVATEDAQTLPVGQSKNAPPKWPAPGLSIQHGEVQEYSGGIIADNVSVDSIEVVETFEISVVRQ